MVSVRKFSIHICGTQNVETRVSGRIKYQTIPNQFFFFYRSSDSKWHLVQVTRSKINGVYWRIIPTIAVGNLIGKP